MRVTQGTFSYLPDLTDEEIAAQVDYALDRHWAIAIELTDDPHPRNVYWDLWGLPMFEAGDSTAVMIELTACRQAFPSRYIRLSAYDASYGRQTTALSFIVNRPPEEPGFFLERRELADRMIAYSLRSYAADEPTGRRYGEDV